jgi:hypothetical protein
MLLADKARSMRVVIQQGVSEPVVGNPESNSYYVTNNLSTGFGKHAPIQLYRCIRRVRRPFAGWLGRNNLNLVRDYIHSAAIDRPVNMYEIADSDTMYYYQSAWC